MEYKLPLNAKKQRLSSFMREYLLELLESTGQLTLETIVTRLGAASILACFTEKGGDDL